MTIFHERMKILYEDERDKNYKVGRRKFAALCGISKSSMDNYLSGVGWPTFDNFCKICESLEVNPAWLVGKSEIKHNCETRFFDISKRLSKNQMEMVEQYAEFLLYAEAHSRKER